MHGFTIRPALGSDADAACFVVRTVYDEYGFTWEPERYHADLVKLGSYYLARGWPFWVAETDHIVATCGLEIFPRVPGQPGTLVEHESKPRIAGTDCALERLYVLRDSRRFGIGRALFARSLGEARQRGLAAMEIWSDKRFKEAHGLYASAGATKVADRICPGDPDKADEWGFILPLR
jgi:putative acetyltransferase